jgi:hypothetical protein
MWRHNKQKTLFASRDSPRRLWDPNSLPFNDHRGLFPKLKGPRHDRAHSPSSTTEELEEKIKASTFSHQSDDYCCQPILGAMLQFWNWSNLRVLPLHFLSSFFLQCFSLRQISINQFRSIWKFTTKCACSIP